MHHIYQPLTGPSSVRLLRLLPGSLNDIIQCELFIFDIATRSDVDLGKKDSFDALSYVWGDATVHSEILLDGWPTKIRKNLWNFLWQQRQMIDEPYIIWVDALCINQDSNAERSRQVRMMGDIYSASTRVIVWLGKSDLEISRALSFMANIGRLTTEASEARAILEPFATHEYFTRIWIIQECLLARELVILSGECKLRWQEMEKYWTKNVQAGPAARQIEMPLSSLRTSPAATLILQRQTRLNSKLIDLVVQTKDCKASERRDKIYALLGIAADRDKVNAINVDYSQTTEQLLINVLKACQIQPLNLIRYAIFLWEIICNAPTRFLVESGTFEIPGQQLSISRPSTKGQVTGVIAKAYEMGQILSTWPVSGDWDYNQILLELMSDNHNISSSDAAFILNQLTPVLDKLCKSHNTDVKVSLIYSTGLQKRQTLVAAIHGNVAFGDHVYGFLGSEVALVLDSSGDTQRERNRTVEGIVVAAVLSKSPSTDSLTDRQATYFTTFDETDLAEPPHHRHHLDIHFSVSDLLAFMQLHARLVS